MKGVFLFSLFITLTTYQHTDQKLKITRHLTAKSGFQIIEFENTTVTNFVSNRKPLRIELYSYKVKSVLNEFNLIDFELLNKEIAETYPINSNVYPRVYYQIIKGNDTIQTKEFLLARIPNSLKRLDKLLFNYSIGM